MRTFIRKHLVTLTLITAIAGGYFAGSVGADSPLRIVQYISKKTAPTISAGAVTFNLANGPHFQTTLNANITSITISNPPTTGYESSFTVVLTQDGTGSRTVAGWPASVKWPGASAPTQTATASKSDIYTFTTYDGGTTWWNTGLTQNL